MLRTVFEIIFIATLIALSIPTLMVMFEEVTPDIVLEGEAVDKQAEFTLDVARLIEYADSLGYQLTFGEAYRTMYQQRHYVAKGLSWTYNSKHLKRRAVDFNLFIDGRYQTTVEPYRELGDYWESLNEGNKWGGSWKRTPDAPHFERN